MANLVVAFGLCAAIAVDGYPISFATEKLSWRKLCSD
ncbi:hypothetical protein QO004_000163 [Rhizobium mesoamericanum]|nr:hypothetical protein [Rhizobium mesoamericanum]